MGFPMKIMKLSSCVLPNDRAHKYLLKITLIHLKKKTPMEIPSSPVMSYTLIK